MMTTTKMRAFRPAPVAARRADGGRCAMGPIPHVAVGIADTMIAAGWNGTPTTGVGNRPTPTRLLGATT